MYLMVVAIMLREADNSMILLMIALDAGAVVFIITSMPSGVSALLLRDRYPKA